MEHTELWETTMDPVTRTSMQVTWEHEPPPTSSSPLSWARTSSPPFLLHERKVRFLDI